MVILFEQLLNGIYFVANSTNLFNFAGVQLFRTIGGEIVARIHWLYHLSCLAAEVKFSIAEMDYTRFDGCPELVNAHFLLPSFKLNLVDG